ncbi:Reverse transcriptase (RNA-dependent DNA polymerase) [Fragilaria crotonensis]|nr:Reverse transcriptase (RNA-dependent DNA polymerase) [Fragilaria crotonensis]
MRWDPSSDQFAKKEETYVSSVSVAETLLATDHVRNASRLVSAVKSLSSMNAPIGLEDDSLGNRLVAAINVAVDDIVGDGLSGRTDNDVYPMDGESRKLFSLSTSEKRSALTPEILSRRWGVGLDTAKRTLQVTTQSGIRNVLAPGERKVFTNGRGSDHFYPMKSKGLAGQNALMPFIQEVGIPQTIVTDNAPEEVHGRVPDEDVLGCTPDISQYAQFDWYEPVMYWDPVGSFPFEQKLFGRWIGVAEVSTDLMAFYILTRSGKVIVRKSVWGLSEDDLANPDIKLRLSELDEGIHQSKIGDGLKTEDIDPDLMDSMPEVPDDVFEDDEDDVQSGTGDLDGTAKDVEDHTPESYDEYLTAQVLLPQGGEAKKATVIGRKRDHDGRPIGQRHANPLLDSRLYEVEFPDGSTEAITANLIAENMLSQVDDEGRSYAVMSEIVDHRTNGHALSKDDGFVEDKRGRRHPRITTRGWELQVEWRDGSTTWVPLSELKESNPIQVAEYAVANKIAEEPAFAWWVRNVLRKGIG